MVQTNGVATQKMEAACFVTETTMVLTVIYMPLTRMDA